MATGYDLYNGRDEGEAFALLDSSHSGQLHVWAPELHRSEITFMHFAPGPEQGGIVGHLANSNPALARLGEDPRATFVVQGPSAYIPSHWSEGPYAVPTSYYAWAQFDVEVELVTDPAPVEAILRDMMARLQPEGSHSTLSLDDSGWQKMLGVITGLRMQVKEARSRHKFGQNKPPSVRESIAARLTERRGRDDAAAARAVLNTLE